MRLAKRNRTRPSFIMINFIAISDTHCHLDVIENIIALECQSHPEIIGVLHCGDVSLFDYHNLTTASEREQRLLAKHANPVHLVTHYLNGKKHFLRQMYVIPGNHEDFTLVTQLQTGERQINGLHVLKQGECLPVQVSQQTLKILGIGKILPWQQVGFKNKPKQIQEQDLKTARQAIKQGPVDIMLLHEPPVLQTYAKRRRGPIFGSLELKKLILDIRPRLVLAGHMHYEYQTVIEDIPIIGLGYGAEGRYALIDERLQVTFKSLKNELISLTNVVTIDEKDLPRDDKPELKTTVNINPHIRKSKSRIARPSPLPVTRKDIRQRFALTDQDNAILTEYFSALKAKIAIQPSINREEALTFAEKFLAKN